MRDPTLPPSPVNGVMIKEKAKDKNIRLAREASEAKERQESYFKRAKTIKHSLPLTNRTATVLAFKLYCDPPQRFTLGTYSTSTTGSIQGMEEELEEDVIISLKPGENLVAEVNFVPPLPSDPDQWPLVRTTTLPGNLTIEYVNGFTQLIPLSAEMLRPLLVVAPLFFDFRDVNSATEVTLGVKDNKRQATFTLRNASNTPAAWKVVHLPRKSKFKDVSAMDTRVLATMTNPEFEERYDWEDEPEVFEFDEEKGMILPQSKIQVTVTFKPKIREDYFSTFRFVTPFTALEEQDKAEPGATINLLGTGEYGETGDADYDYHY